MTRDLVKLGGMGLKIHLSYQELPLATGALSVLETRVIISFVSSKG